jgi:hypothetical protein
MSIIKIWTTLLAVSIFFLIVNIPAQILKPYLKNSIDFPFSLSGSVWKGSMSSKHFQSASWQIEPIYLLLAKVSSKINVEIDTDNKISAHAEISPFSKLSLNAISGVLTTQYLQQFFPNTPFMLSSSININQTKAKWNNLFPPYLPSEAQGILMIQNTNFLGENLGDYKLNYLYLGRSLKVDISSTNSSSVEALIKINISKEKKFKLSGKILPKTKDLQAIFKELNISLTPNISFQLDL